MYAFFNIIFTQNTSKNYFIIEIQSLLLIETMYPSLNLS